MSDKELKRNLEILRYNPKKHRNVNEALNDILNSEEYAPILKGIINDKKYVYELQCIMEAYNKIKNIVQSEIDSIYENKEEILDNEIKIDDMNEVIFYLDNGSYHLAHKNSNGEYQDKLTFKQQDYINISNKYDCVICTQENGCTIYNLNGDAIFSGSVDIDCIIWNKIILLKRVNDDENKSCIIDIIGRTLELSMNVEKDKRIYDFIKNFGKQIEEDNFENLMFLFNNLLNGFCPEYLFDLSYDLGKIMNGKYIYCTKGNEKCYFEILGDRIISTEDYEYCDIPNNNKNSDSSIIPVCKYNMNFEKKYGLFDLDYRTEIVDCQFDYVYDWDSLCTIAYNKIDGNIVPSLITRDNHGKINIINNVSELVYVKVGYKIISLKNVSKSVYENYYELVIPRNVRKLCDNLYLFQNYVVDKKGNFYQLDGENFSLVKNLTSNPEIIFTTNGFVECNGFWLDGYILYRNHSNNYAVDYHGNVSELTLEFLLKNIKNVITPILLKNDSIVESNLSSSAFTLPRIKKENLISKEDTKLSLYQKQEIISSVESGFKLVPTNIKVNSESMALLDKNGLNVGKEQINFFIGHEEFVRVDITKNKDVNISSYFNHIPKNTEEKIFVSKSSKKIIREKNFKIIDVYDKYICVETKYGNGKKQYLLENDSTLTIGPFDRVVDYRNDTFILQDKNRCQCYRHGIPITYVADDIVFIPKRFVSIDGIIKKTSYILKIENAGCLYVIDVDGDIILRKNSIVENLERLIGETNESKQKILSKPNK